MRTSQSRVVKPRIAATRRVELPPHPVLPEGILLPRFFPKPEARDSPSLGFSASLLSFSRSGLVPGAAPAGAQMGPAGGRPSRLGT